MLIITARFILTKFFQWRITNLKFYLSHSIRGKAGLNASQDIQAQNCRDAILVADTLRKLFPKLELYVPAESETFVQIAYDNAYLNIDDILWIDCRIIDNMDGLLVYVPQGNELQGGRLVEYRHAMVTNKLVVVFNKVSEAADWLNAKYRGELI